MLILVISTRFQQERDSLSLSSLFFCFLFCFLLCFVFVFKGRGGCEEHLHARHICREPHSFPLPAGHYNLRVLVALSFTSTDRENSILHQRQHAAFCLVNGSGPLSIMNYVPVASHQSVFPKPYFLYLSMGAKISFIL